MPEIAILHVCPHCQKVFDSPSICIEGDCETVPTPSFVPSQQARDLGLVKPEPPKPSTKPWSLKDLKWWQ